MCLMSNSYILIFSQSSRFFFARYLFQNVNHFVSFCPGLEPLDTGPWNHHQSNWSQWCCYARTY